jgi:hypothetical protein
MNGTTLTLFAEELLPLMQKYGYRGMVGFVMSKESKPACFHLTVAGEPPAFYQAMQARITGILSSFSGKQPIESGEVRFVPKKSDNNEMPF